MSNFKIGDKVRVIGKRRDYHMFRPGQIVEVIGPGMSSKSYSCRGKDGLEQYVPKEDLVPIQGKILVTTDGVVTTAKLFHGKELVKSAEAKCSPSDAFDFEKGAALAVDRLLDREQKAAQEVPKFPLEKLQTGVFGCTSNGKWFVVVGDSLVYETGGFDMLPSLDREGYFVNYGVDCIVEACSYNNARSNVSEKDRAEFRIWSRPGTKFDK